MDVGNFRKMYTVELQEACSLESQLIGALPQMAEVANNPQLKQAIRTHLEETRGHRRQIEDLLKRHGAGPDEHTDQAMQTMIREADKWVWMVHGSGARDAGLIASAQRIEHYEIAIYGTLATWAEQLGLEEDQHALHGILEQEKHADDELTKLAKSSINPHASARAA
jgi:ferritin-like metal-binding protein YciE